MFTMPQSLRAWGMPGFAETFKQELAQHAEQLPLQQGLALSSSVAEAPVTVLIQSAAESANIIRVKAGIFYEGMIGGCACANDPTPESNYTEYCELLLELDKASAAVTVTLLRE